MVITHHYKVLSNLYLFWLYVCFSMNEMKVIFNYEFTALITINSIFNSF